jgi:hypothetical protein
MLTKVGIQALKSKQQTWIPAKAGMTLAKD